MSSNTHTPKHLGNLMNEIYIKKLHPAARLPHRATPLSSGYDLYSVENTTLLPFSTSIVKLGISVKFPTDHVALIWDRSGLGAKGIHRFAGVIDPDYRGEWKVVLYNSSPSPYSIFIGDRVAQVLFQRVEHWDVYEVDVIDTTTRNEGGFGSTGR